MVGRDEGGGEERRKGRKKKGSIYLPTYTYFREYLLPTYLHREGGRRKYLPTYLPA